MGSRGCRSSALRDPSLALTAVAQALEVKEEPGRALAETLAAKLAGTRALLVLDNAEHLLPAVAGELARLRDADGPTLLVTSRERLGLEGEHVWPVPPLDEDDGVALFVTRARSLDPSFTSTAEVDQLCAAAGQPAACTGARRRPDLIVLADPVARSAGATPRSPQGRTRGGASPRDVARDDRLVVRAARRGRAATLPRPLRLPRRVLVRGRRGGRARPSRTRSSP